MLTAAGGISAISPKGKLKPHHNIYHIMPTPQVSLYEYTQWESCWASIFLLSRASPKYIPMKLEVLKNLKSFYNIPFYGCTIIHLVLILLEISAILSIIP